MRACIHTIMQPWEYKNYRYLFQTVHVHAYRSWNWNKAATKPCKFTGGMGNDWGKKVTFCGQQLTFSRTQTIVTILKIELRLNVWNSKNHEFYLFSGPELCSWVFIAWLVHVLKKAFGYIEGQSCPFWQHLAFCFAKATEHQNQI